MSDDLKVLFGLILEAEGSDRRDAVRKYADALEAAGDHDRAWMFRQKECPLGMSPEELRKVSRRRVVMQRIRAGEFLMGSTGEEPFAEENDIPRHKVVLTKDFEMGVFPVTQEQYRRVIKAYASSPNADADAKRLEPKPSEFSGNPDRPVEYVSWWDALRFCNALSLMENKRPYYRIVTESGNMRAERNVDADGYRLPTEAEWEFAARAGSTTVWPWGDDGGGVWDHAWFYDNSDEETQCVGELRPNAWGLYDTVGNVWEWCDDVAGKVNLESEEEDDPEFDVDCIRVFRGGSWGDAHLYVRPECREWRKSDSSSDDTGFRVVRTCD